MWLEADEIQTEIAAVPVDAVLTQAQLDELLGKILLVKTKLDAIETKLEKWNGGGVIEQIWNLDDDLELAKTRATNGNLTGTDSAATALGSVLIALTESPDGIYATKALIYIDIDWIVRKLTEINRELPPDVEFNGTIIGKKEQAKAITGPDGTGTGDTANGDIGTVVGTLVTALNKDDLAKSICTATTGDTKDEPFDPIDITFEHVGLTASTGNLIAGNVITTNVVTNELNIGIKLECSENDVVNNLITNEDIINGRAGFYGTMDRGIIMLSSHNKIVYNAIEYVDIGIVRGGYEERDDVQQEYLFKKLAKAQCYKPQGGCLCTRPLSIIPVLEKQDEPITVLIGDEGHPIVVKWNRIALNLIEHTGYGIQIVEAESNQIDENMFIENTDGGIYFEDTVGPHIIMVHNDFVGGISVANEGATDRDASENYALDSPTSGPVTDPAAGTPFCSANFGTSDKFEDLEIEEFFNENYPTLPPMAQSSDLRKLVVAGVTFTLPDEKPRTCADVFGGTPQPQPGEECCDLEAGWNFISLPVDPDNPDPTVVFLDDPLYLCTYNTAAGDFEWVDKPASATAGTAGALTTVSALGGYWLASQTGGQFCVTGTALTGNQVVDLATLGWHMIGVPYDTAWGNATGAAVKFTRNGVDKWLTDAVAANWIYGTVIGWDTTADEFIRTTVETGTTLVPCDGYWIRTRVSGLTMTFTDAPWDPGNPPTFGTQSLKSEDPGNPPMPVHVTPLTFDPSKLEFGNYPNPITDVHTTTFAVKGVMATFVDAIKVQIFDLSGQKVYEEEMAGTSIDWHTANDYGEYLANGVYLYKMYAKVQGQWVVSEVKKLAILR